RISDELGSSPLGRDRAVRHRDRLVLHHCRGDPRLRQHGQHPLPVAAVEPLGHCVRGPDPHHHHGRHRFVGAGGDRACLRRLRRCLWAGRVAVGHRPIVIVAGIIIGAINGLISRALRVNSLIVTLATATIIYGAIWAQTKGDNRGSVPDFVTDFVSVIGWTGPIPVPGAVILWAFLVLVFVILERRSVLGRWVYASGANPGAAELAHIPSLLLWTVVFAISGGLSALAGILLAGFSSAANPQVGDAYLFTTLSAVVIGGTPIIGGRGGYARTVAGCFIITELTMLLIGLGLDEAAQQVS